MYFSLLRLILPHPQAYLFQGKVLPQKKVIHFPQYNSAYICTLKLLANLQFLFILMYFYVWFYFCFDTLYYNRIVILLIFPKSIYLYSFKGRLFIQEQYNYRYWPIHIMMQLLLVINAKTNVATFLNTNGLNSPHKESTLN